MGCEKALVHRALPSPKRRPEDCIMSALPRKLHFMFDVLGEGVEMVFA